jgi:hypothetical protein
MAAYIIFQMASGFMVGYVASSLVESIAHQKISDAPRKYIKLWSRYPRLFKLLIQANYSHHVIHHRKTFRGNYIKQFRSEQERHELEVELLSRGHHGRIIINSNYAMKLQGTGAVAFVLPFIPFVALTFVFFNRSVASGFALAAMLPPLLSNYIHPFLHKSYDNALTQAPRIIKILLKTRYFRNMMRHHYLHHRYMACNFNLLLGGDWLRQAIRNLLSGNKDSSAKHVFRRATIRDLEDMQSLGLPID